MILQAQAESSSVLAQLHTDAVSGSLPDAAYVYNILLVGETGSGKTTLLNMLVNYFRGGPDARTKLPNKQDLKLAVSTAYLKATEPEGVYQSERDVADSKPLTNYVASLHLVCKNTHIRFSIAWCLAGSKSQSTKSIGYVFDHNTAEGAAVKIHVVDTPGLSDTQGDQTLLRLG